MKLSKLLFVLFIIIRFSDYIIAQDADNCIQTILEYSNEEHLNKTGRDKNILKYKESDMGLLKYKVSTDSIRQIIAGNDDLSLTEKKQLENLTVLMVNSISGDVYKEVRELPKELSLKFNELMPLARLYAIDAQSKRYHAHIESINKWAMEICKYCAFDTVAKSKPSIEMLNYNLKENDIIADIGAGNGILEKAIARFCNNITVYANDIVPDKMDSLQTRLIFLDIFDRKNINYHTITGTKTSTMLPVNTFDKIIVKNAFHHFECPGEMLEDFKSILKKEGSLFIVDATKEEAGEKPICNLLLPRQVMFKYLDDSGFELVKEIALDYDNFRLFEFKVGK